MAHRGNAYFALERSHHMQNSTPHRKKVADTTWVVATAATLVCNESWCSSGKILKLRT
jgi:hypothetical protein